MTGTRVWVIALLMTAGIPGCKDQHQAAKESSSASGNPAPQSTVAPFAKNDVTDKWLGKWTGPEGTYLVLSKNAEKYVVLINSLDGPATYEGTSNGERIQFQRDGKMESIHPRSGPDTGMKWLMDETNCLIIKTGEGFCRH